MSTWKVEEEFLGQKIIMAYKLVVPGPNREPQFMNIQVKMIRDCGESVLVEMNENGSLAKMLIPKENIQHLCYISEIKQAGLTLPANFRS